jgi:hypothetical protein
MSRRDKWPAFLSTLSPSPPSPPLAVKAVKEAGRSVRGQWGGWKSAKYLKYVKQEKQEHVGASGRKLGSYAGDAFSGGRTSVFLGSCFGFSVVGFVGFGP